MNTQEQLVEILQKDAEALTSIWAVRLHEFRVVPSHFSGLPPRAFSMLMADLVHLLEGRHSLSSTARSVEEIRQKEQLGLWGMDLRHGLEIFLIGETVVREWVFRQWPGTAREKGEVFELLNRAFQSLLVAHARDYCQHCRAALTPAPRGVGKERVV